MPHASEIEVDEYLRRQLNKYARAERWQDREILQALRDDQQHEIWQIERKARQMLSGRGQ